MDMKRILFSLLFIGACVYVTSCSPSGTDAGTTPSNDSVSASNAPDAMKRFMDSIMKANPGASISIEGSDSTKLSASDTSGLNGAGIRTLHKRVVDSLLRSSKQKYTVLHFWATWCLPCRREFPDLVKEAATLKNSQVLLVSCDYDSEAQRKKVLAVYNKLHTGLPLYLNESVDRTDGMGTASQEKLLKELGMNTHGGLPFNVVMDNKSKKVVFSSAEYKKAFEYILHK